MTDLVRWRLDDPTDSSLYIFENNPKTGGSAAGKRQTATQSTSAANGNPLFFEGEEALRTATLEGVVRSRAMYETLVDWANKRHPVKLTDDLGRQNYITITGLNFKREPKRPAPDRHSYTITYLVVQIVNP